MHPLVKKKPDAGKCEPKIMDMRERELRRGIGIPQWRRTRRKGAAMRELREGNIPFT